MIKAITIIGMMCVMVGCIAENNVEENRQYNIPAVKSPELGIVLPNKCVANKKCFEVILDSSLSKEWKQTIINSYDTWSVVVGDTYLYRITESDTPLGPDYIRWNQVKQEEIPGYIGYTSVKGHWVKVLDTAPLTWQFVIGIHELGHVLGLHHIENVSIASIMHPILKVNDTITCVDERNVCAIWKCQVSDKCKEDTNNINTTSMPIDNNVMCGTE